jgi:hypothetical protein
LKPYFGEEDELSSRTTSIQEGEDDEDIPTVDTTTTHPHVQGPFTRARARQLNYQVLSFLTTVPNIHENMMLPKSDVLVLLKNDGLSMDERGKYWSMVIHGEGNKHMIQEEDAASGEFRTLMHGRNIQDYN